MNWLLRIANLVLEPVVRVQCLALRAVYINWLLRGRSYSNRLYKLLLLLFITGNL